MSGIRTGSRVGSFEILDLLGEGGMGQVWRARDLRLKREVALKVLPEARALDADRLARFQREAELLAALNHPNIAAIHGLEDFASSEGLGAGRAIVMELVEGLTLEERLRQVGQGKGLPLEEVLPLARQLVEALEYAHERDVLHRDLKPANLKVTPQGQLKVLDFGLAKLAASRLSVAGADARRDPLSPRAQPGPTVTSPAHAVGDGEAITEAGMMLGTAAYMSPEQARGRSLDKRGDIWAFGCILFELLTGSRPFSGETVSDTIAAILKSDPDWSKLGDDVPTGLSQLLRHCLQRDPRERLRDIGDARFELRDHAAQPSFGARVGLRGPSPRGPGASRAAYAAWVLAGIGAFGAGWLARPTTPPINSSEPEVLSIAHPPDAWSGGSFAISPDGRKIATSSFVDGNRQLYVRNLSSSHSAWRRVPGGEGARNSLFWSPDSGSVGFFTESALKVADAAGTTVRTLTRQGGGLANETGTWVSNRAIIFASLGSPIYQVTTADATPSTVMALAPDHRRYGKLTTVAPGRLIGFVAGGERRGGVGVFDLEHSTVRSLVEGANDPVVWNDWLLFAKDGSVFGQRLDRAALELSGPPIPLTTGVLVPGSNHSMSASNSGDLLFQAAAEPDAPTLELQWVDRSGGTIGRIALTGTNITPGPRLTRDGKRLAYTDANHIWVADTGGGLPQTFGQTPAFEASVVWRPDGRGLAWYAPSLFGVFESPSDRYQPTRILSFDESRYYPFDWSRDGERLLVTRATDMRPRDIYQWSRSSGTVVPWLNTPSDEVAARYSPDGRWVAYHANDTGQYEVYVRSADGTSQAIRVSSEGGSFPVWRGDSKELFYAGRRGGIYAAIVSGETVPTFSSPERLFSIRLWVEDGLNSPPFDVTPDGQRFVALVIRHQGPPATYIRNFPALLERREAELGGTSPTADR